MAAASALRDAQVFEQCGVDPPRFADRLGAMDLYEAWQGAAQAVQQLDAAGSSLPEQAGLQGNSAFVLSSSGHLLAKVTQARECSASGKQYLCLLLSHLKLQQKTPVSACKCDVQEL
jgi:hypothetical protein